MKIRIAFMLIIASLMSCETKTETDLSKPTPIPIIGTWQLITGIIIEKADTLITDYTKNISFIKIINETHFAFLKHDLNKGKDSSAVFVSGGGKYTFKNSTYTEHLEYCSARDWEDNYFTFTMVLKNDTLIQSGVEIVESTGVNRLNTEKYVRVKS